MRKLQGRLEEAARAYCRAIELVPDHADAHLNLGNVLRRLGRIDEAVAACRKAIELKPQQGAAYENLATILHRAGRIREAVAELRKWLGFSPDNAIARHMLAAYTGEAVPDRAPDRFCVPVARSHSLSSELPTMLDSRAIGTMNTDATVIGKSTS